ncbi:MAG: arsenical pump-driving ATPase [Planctomycetaceae bacterium]|nr:arsenical pump-driving ATPase [Planctomycetaceae bacterium]
MNFLNHQTRVIFFTGKGGVGKTTVACATAVKLAEAGKKVLLVSTDPASNLDEVLETTLRNHPTPISTVPNLMAMNLDPEKLAFEYRERVIGPYRGLLPESVLKSMEEQFSGACTREIAAFDEFARLLADPSDTAEFCHLIFDTAPTGHTLRLLTLPAAWDDFLEQNQSGTTCLGPLAGLQSQQQLYRAAVGVLSDPVVTTMVLVTRAETSTLAEAARTSDELSKLGISNQHLVVNGLFLAKDTNDPYAVALEKRHTTALATAPANLANLPQTVVPWSPHEFLGVAALRRFGSTTACETATQDTGSSDDAFRPPQLSDLVDELVADGHGVIFAMGKGGVGKTTVAAAISIAIAERGFEVHLSTTDPAAHLAAVLNNERLPNLTVSRIDPAVETAKYAGEVMRKSGSNLDDSGQALLAEDLRSPCTEEIAVFRAFADAVAEGVDKFVVLDTAPTGHTILLLDSALAFHRDVTRQSREVPDAVASLLPRLRDPSFTRVLIVTLPEPTPVHEAAELQRDLRRASIQPYAWIVNQVLRWLPITDPLLMQKRSREEKYLQEVTKIHAEKVAVIPWQIEPPIGVVALRHLTGGTSLVPNMPERTRVP